MTHDGFGGGRIQANLRSEDGVGAVRVEVRLDADPEDVWSALTDPIRLASWYGEIQGDLRVRGEFRASLFASGWNGTGRVEVCDPLKRLVLVTRDADPQPGQPNGTIIEVELAADLSQTVFVVEERGMPSELLAAYGAGIQVHVEDLTAHLAGRHRGDAEARWKELFPAYQNLPTTGG